LQPEQTLSPSAPQPLAQLSADPIFVVGRFRSGTTWVYDILTAHPDAAGAFESWLFTGVCGVAALFSPANFNHDVERFGRTYRLGQLITRERLIEDVRALVSRWLGEALEPHHRFLIEKTPSHYETMGLIAELFPRARFVHVLRDGRDVAVSARAAAESWGQGHFRGSIRSVAADWERVVQTTRRHGASLGDAFMEIRFEDLKAAPHDGIRELFDFCSMPYDDALVSQIVEETAFGARGQAGETSFRRRGEAGEWRQRLSVLDRMRFERASHGFLVQTGYARNRWWWLTSGARWRRDRTGVNGKSAG
jgi:hypothetical protein